MALKDRLPEVRGGYREQAELAKTNWFNIGGPAEILFKPEDTEDLAHFFKHKPADVPVTVLGVGSNLLVRDGGIDGVVIKLGRRFAEIESDGLRVKAGAGALGLNVARFAQMEGISGLEFLSGIPGTVGGALAMNAGAYGKETREVLVSATAVDEHGKVHTLSNGDMKFVYRGNGIPNSWIFTEAVFEGMWDDKAAIGQRMDEIAKKREDSQPTRSRTGGSTFKNPDPALSGGKKAWELIDAAGCRGLKMGGAQVSEKHCNFFINTGGATARDVEGLGEEVRRRVREQFGVELVWEIRRIGKE